MAGLDTDSEEDYSYEDDFEEESETDEEESGDENLEHSHRSKNKPKRCLIIYRNWSEFINTKIYAG